MSQKYFIIIARMHNDNKCKQKKSQNDGLLIFSKNVYSLVNHPITGPLPVRDA